MIKIGKKIKSMREERELTHSALAEAIGCSSGLISLWEHGLRIPSAESLVSLSTFFKVTTDYLLGLEDMPV